MEASLSLIKPDDQSLDNYIEYPVDCDPFQSNVYRNLCHKAALLLASGNSIAGTAALCGIHRMTLHQWVKSNHFNAIIEGEKTRLRQELLDRICAAGEKPHLWAANAWYLERNKAFGDEFKLNKDDQGRGNVVVQIAISHPAMQP